MTTVAELELVDAHAKAIVGLAGNAHVHVHVHGCSEEQLEFAFDSGGDRTMLELGDERWDSVSIRRGRVEITFHGARKR